MQLGKLHPNSLKNGTDRKTENTSRKRHRRPSLMALRTKTNYIRRFPNGIRRLSPISMFPIFIDLSLALPKTLRHMLPYMLLYQTILSPYKPSIQTTYPGSMYDIYLISGSQYNHWRRNPT